MSGRRFLWRWAWRMLRLEWRQHLGVLTLIAGAVAISIGAVVAAFNLAEPPALRYGTGHVRALVTGDAGPAIAAVDQQGHPWGAVEWATARAPGAKRGIEVRVFDPENPVSAPLLAVVDGRLPAGDDEVAVTVGVAADARSVGRTLQLGGATRTVVGVVENPTDLDDQFAVAAGLDGYDIEPAKRSTIILVDADPADVTFPADVGAISTESRGGATAPAVRTMVAIAVNAVSAVAMLVVALLIGAAFAVLARRRARQYGLLASAGAGPGQLRRLALIHGFTVGVIAASIGAVVGLVAVALVLPRMEETVAHRIDLSVPWWSVVPTILLAVGSSSLAAWWPARSLARQPVVEVLASVRPRPSSTTGSTSLGATATVLGAIGLVAGTARLSLPLVLVGMSVALVGLLLLAPALIDITGRLAGRLPLAGRMAGRAIARHQGRSAALVAALAVALGIPVGLAVVTASIDARNGDSPLNLSPDLAIAWSPGAGDSTVEIPAPDVAIDGDVDGDVDGEGGRADLQPPGELAAAAPGAVVAPIRVAVAPDARLAEAEFDELGPTLALAPVFAVRPFNGTCGTTCDVNTLGDRDENGREIELTFHDAWVADPELLEALGTAPDGADRSALAISPFADAMLSTHRGQTPELASMMTLDPNLPTDSSVAAALIRPETVTANGWDTLTIGWLLASDEPWTAEELAAIDRAVGDELTLETTIEPVARGGLRAAGVAVGALVSIGILLAALALLGADSADDLRILQAIGAGPGQHRRLSAATASILAAAGAMLAVPAGYLALIVLVADRETNYRFALPWPTLISVLILLPLMAAGVGWAASRTRTTNLAAPTR